MKNTTERKNVYEMVTERVLEQMAKGVCPWHRPWASNGGGVTGYDAVSHDSGKAYSFINQLLLGRGGEWLTFNQVKSEGGSVKKGEKASFVVFWKMQVVKRTNEQTGEEDTETFPVLRHYYVSHIDQCEGIKPRHAHEIR